MLYQRSSPRTTTNSQPSNTRCTKCAGKACICPNRPKFAILCKTVFFWAKHPNFERDKVQSAFDYNVDEHITFKWCWVVHPYIFCCLRVVQIPLPPRFCWHLLFKPTFDIPILFLPFAMVGLFSLFWQKCTIHIVKILFLMICKSHLLDSELIVHYCTRLSVGMTWDWSKQRVNDRYKDHQDGQLTTELPSFQNPNRNATWVEGV